MGSSVETFEVGSVLSITKTSQQKCDHVHALYIYCALTTPYTILTLHFLDHMLLFDRENSVASCSIIEAMMTAAELGSLTM